MPVCSYTSDPICLYQFPDSRTQALLMDSSSSVAAAATTALSHQQGRGSDSAQIYREEDSTLTPHVEAFGVTEQSRLASLF